MRLPLKKKGTAYFVTDFKEINALLNNNTIFGHRKKQSKIHLKEEGFDYCKSEKEKNEKEKFNHLWNKARSN